MNEDKNINATLDIQDQNAVREQDPIQETTAQSIEGQPDPAPVQQEPDIIQDAAVAPTQAQDAKPQAQEDPESYVRFSKPYSFEKKSYAGIDLSGMEQLSAKDMIEAEKYLSKKGIISPIPEMTMEYVGFIANRATGQPIEFFTGLPPKDAIKVKNKVSGFFYGED